MRVDDNVGGHAGVRERHVRLRPQNRKDAFLAVAAREFVAHNWVPLEAQLDRHLGTRTARAAPGATRLGHAAPARAAFKRRDDVAAC